MKNLITITIFSIIVSFANAGWFSSEGELKIKSNKKGATIFIDGDKKGIVGDGFTSIIVDEGEHKIRIFEHTKEWNYEGIENTFVAGKSSIEIYTRVNKLPTKYRVNRLKKEKIAREEYLEKQRIKRIEEKKKEKIALDKKLKAEGIIKQKKLMLELKKVNFKTNNGTVTDKKTSLMWKRCSEGQTLKYNVCNSDGKGYYAGKVLKLKKKEAISYASNIKFAGYSDWRLPTIKELNTLVYCKNKINYKHDGYDSGRFGTVCNKIYDKAINESIFPNTKRGGYISSTDNWHTEFYYGKDEYLASKHKKFLIRLVRDE